MELSGFHQYLSFSLDGERYAVRIDKVHEVLEYTHITRLPRTSEFLKGIINVRGAAYQSSISGSSSGCPRRPSARTPRSS